MTRSIRGASGELLGVVLVGIQLKTFLDLFSDVLPAGIASVALFHDDGRVIFGYPMAEEPLGLWAAERSLFSTYLVSSPFGTYQAKSPVSGEDRLISYRAIEGVPVVIAVDAALANVLGPWRQRATIYGIAALGVSLFILALTIWLDSQVRRDEKTRKTLLVSERSLENSQRMAGVGYFERDVRANSYSWSENTYRIHGVSPDTFYPDRDATLSLIIDEDRERIEEKIHYYEKHPGTGQIECRIRRPDGELRNMVYEWQIITDRDGSPIKVFGVAQDITDLKEKENAIRENEERLQDITECISDFIWEGDKDGVLTHFDSGARDTKIDAVIGETRDENIDHEADGGDASELGQAMDQHKTFRNLVIPFRNKKGDTRWIRISGNPRFDSNGVFIGYRGAGSDVTEQRTLHLNNMETAKSEALARLAGGMAHEINNILQPVMVYSSMGELDKDEEGQIKKYFQKIFSATEQAMHIVKDVLTYAREGRADRTNISLAATMQESVELLRPAMATGITVTVDIDDDVQVNAQDSGLQRVILNLLRNAADATGSDGNISLHMGRVQIGPDDARQKNLLPGSYGYFTVTDNGPGITEKNLIKIFDPFFTTKPIGAGTGLGLSVVTGLVQEWGGAVDVESRPGRTVFTVYIPVDGAVKQAAE